MNLTSVFQILGVAVITISSLMSYSRQKYIGAFSKYILGSGLQAKWFDVDPIPLLTMSKAYRLVEMMPYVSDLVNWGQPEYFARASETLDKESGDCDDKSILLASLWYGMGYKPIVVIADTVKGGHAFLEMNGYVYDPTWDEYEVPMREYYDRFSVSPLMWFGKDYYGAFD